MENLTVFSTTLFAFNSETRAKATARAKELASSFVGLSAFDFTLSTGTQPGGVVVTVRVRLKEGQTLEEARTFLLGLLFTLAF